jgi:hypothetical protein
MGDFQTMAAAGGKTGESGGADDYTIYAALAW